MNILWQEILWAFRHSILPQGHNLLPSILENEKRYYVSFIDILEVYILISILSKTDCSSGKMSGKICPEKWSVDIKTDWCWNILNMLKRKRKNKFIGTQVMVPWLWISCPHLSQSFLFLPWNLSVDWHLIKIKESTDHRVIWVERYL